MNPRSQVEIFNNHFLAIAEEMGFTILRTGHTIFIKETGDFGTALVTASGEVFAAPMRIGMIRTIGMPMNGAIEGMDHLREGDIWIANDPHHTGGMGTHLPDVFLWKPVIFAGELICFVWAFIHVSDIGGRVPGSVAPLSTEIYQEGLRIPPSRLYRKGVLNQELVDLILANCRIPEENWGDLEAASSALYRGERRILELVNRHGPKMVLQASRDVLDYAEERARYLFERLPDGKYEFTDYLEGGSTLDRPIMIRVQMRVRGDSVWLDFSEADPQVPRAYNIPTAGQERHHYLVVALVTYLHTLERDLPNNSGLVRSVQCQSTPGSVLWPEPDAAVGVRAITMHRVTDAVMGCLAQAHPELIPACGGGGGTVVVLSADTYQERFVSVLEPVTGGSGARPGLDGVNACDVTSATARNIPIEVIESELPILVHTYGLRPSSGGAGRWRGGLGVKFTVELLAPRGNITARGMERRRFRAWGRDGGLPGLAASIRIKRNTGGVVDVPQFDIIELDRGDTITFTATGGGGLGYPRERDPRAVREDVADGYLTAGEAERDYGVVTDGRRLDEALTAKLRAQRPRGGWRPASSFSYGPEWEAYEDSWPPDVVAKCNMLLTTVPASLRFHYREALLSAWRATGDQANNVDLSRLAQQFISGNLHDVS